MSLSAILNDLDLTLKNCLSKSKLNAYNVWLLTLQTKSYHKERNNCILLCKQLGTVNYPLIEIRIKYKQDEILSITYQKHVEEVNLINSLIFWFYKLYILKISNKKNCNVK